ncbi:MAG TPA: YwiC-like family protein [Anaeromyxobacteraceae bacterium]|nr:YwiC-like family protein [Anaeromyxobacteraceae bacterium]
MNGPATTPAPRPRSLLPQEHGAWGQLAMPLLSALAVGRPTAAALLLTAATVLGFLAHEPWLVTLGHRGLRATREEAPRARRVMWQLLAAAAATGGAGLLLAPLAARLALAVPALLVAAVIAFVLARKERTVPGELTVVTALASSGFSVALAAGAPLAAAAASTVTWVLAFAASVFAVQVVLVRGRSRGEAEHGVRNAAIAAVVAGGGSAIAVAAGLGWVVPAAVAPTALLSLLVCLAPFSARQLRTLGWALVGSTTATLVVLVAGLRLGL